MGSYSDPLRRFPTEGPYMLVDLPKAGEQCPYCTAYLLAADLVKKDLVQVKGAKGFINFVEECRGYLIGGQDEI